MVCSLRAQQQSLCHALGTPTPLPICRTPLRRGMRGLVQPGHRAGLGQPGQDRVQLQGYTHHLAPRHRRPRDPREHRRQTVPFPTHGGDGAVENRAGWHPRRAQR